MNLSKIILAARGFEQIGGMNSPDTPETLERFDQCVQVCEQSEDPSKAREIITEFVPNFSY